ncbi:MAG: SMI1/KNR4 family protein [Pseudolysinimonas sp.]
MIGSESLALIRESASDIGPELGAPSRFGELSQILPAAHLDLLKQYNGFTLFQGAFRLFGFRSDSSLDLLNWNAEQTWRFAWGSRLTEYLFIGETGWGDQYAYRLDGSGQLHGSEIYFLEANSMEAESLSQSFEAFLAGEMLRNAVEPYDAMTVDALNANGALDPAEHWVLTPSLVLGGDDRIENLSTLPATTAMIFAGDVAKAMESSRPGALPKAVSPWTDEAGRTRLRVDFA